MPSIPNDIPVVLQQFFKQYLAWVEADCPDNTFVQDAGLCWNLHRWLRSELPCHPDAFASLRAYLRVAMFHSKDYPFNQNEHGVPPSALYDAEVERAEAHLNPQRLAFVRAVVASCSH